MVVYTSVNIVSFTIQYIMNMIIASNRDLTFIELFSRCNNSIDLVFYSFIILIFSVVTLNILSSIKQKSVSEYTQPIDSNNGIYFNILVIFIKLVASMAYVGVFQGVLFLYAHHILFKYNTYELIF